LVKASCLSLLNLTLYIEVNSGRGLLLGLLKWVRLVLRLKPIKTLQLVVPLSRPDMSRLAVSGDIITGGTAGAPVAGSKRVAGSMYYNPLT
jgi:hypothetical protein